MSNHGFKMIIAPSSRAFTSTEDVSVSYSGFKISKLGVVKCPRLGSDCVMEIDLFQFAVSVYW